MSDAEIISAIRECIPADQADTELFGAYLYPYDYLPATAQEGGCFLGYEIEVPSVSANYFFREVAITFRIICRQDAMLTGQKETRPDSIAHRLELLFNGSTEYGGNCLELVSSLPARVSPSHYSRIVRFATQESNRFSDHCSSEE